jgi:hypothetical protein
MLDRERVHGFGGLQYNKYSSPLKASLRRRPGVEMVD